MRPTLALIILLLLTGCVSKEERAAKHLLAEAQIAYQDSDYSHSARLLDSLHRTYSGAVETRKVALHLQQLVRTATAKRDSIRMTSLAEEGVARLDSLQRLFKLIEYPRMPDENILRYKGYDPSAANPEANFLDAYIKADGKIQLIAGTSAPKAQGVTYLRLMEETGGTYVLSDTIPYDKALNYRFRTGGVTHERLTLSLEASERLGAFVHATPTSSAIRASFGPQGKSFTLDARAREAISATYLYFRTYVGIKNAEGEAEAATARAAHFGTKAHLTDPAK